MLQDPKPPMNPKETSLTTHPDESMKMYDIKKKNTTLATNTNYYNVHIAL